LKDETLRRKVRVKAVLCACLLVLCICAGSFAALVRPSEAAQAGARAAFTQRWDPAFATVKAITLRDPFTGRQFNVRAGLDMLFPENEEGVHAYCIQLGQMICDDGGGARRAYSLYDPMFSRLSATAKENIALVALFGYPNRSASALNMNGATAHVATQLLLWESALGYRNTAFRRTDSRIADGYFSGGSHGDVRAVYEAVALRIQEFLRAPSFLEHAPLLLDLTYDPASGLYTQRFTDTNGSNAGLGVSGGDVSVRREGDDYIFSSETLPARTRNLTVVRTDIPAARTGELGPLLIWVDPACGADNQFLFSGVEPREKSWRACLYPGEEETTTSPETTTVMECTTTECTATENITTTAECTTIRATTTAIITTDCTTVTETTAEQTTTTRTRTTHPRATRQRPATTAATKTTTTTATTTSSTTTSSTTTSSTTKATTTTRKRTTLPTCAVTATRPATTTTRPTTQPTTRRTTCPAATTAATAKTGTVTPPGTGETRAAPLVVLVLCTGVLGLWLARRKREGEEV